MSRNPYAPKGFGGDRPSPEMIKQQGWLDHGIFAVDLHDARLDMIERQLVTMIGTRLYGERKEDDVAV